MHLMIRKNTIIFLQSLLICLNGLYAQTVQEVAQKAYESTVVIIMEDDKGNPISLGSGFFVSNKEIATNYHVIQNTVKGYVKLIGKNIRYNIESISLIDIENDLAVLQLSSGNFKALRIGDSDKVEVGQTIFAIGNPYGLEGTFSQGLISGIRKDGYRKLLQITAPISSGSSGGPVLNEKAEIIGISVSTLENGQNINFAIPSNYLKILVDKQSRSNSYNIVKKDDYVEFVIDSAKIISSKDKKTINRIANDIKRKTGAEIVVLTVNSIEPYENIEEYAFNIANKMRIGEKNQNNGILIVLSVGDRKIRIEVGNGLEKVLYNTLAGSIIDNFMIPYFVKNNYSLGLKMGYSEVAKILANFYGITIDNIEP